jgi:type I restriction enzyme M protein
MFEAAFKNIDDTLRKDGGCTSELDYIEQTSWILFLKYLDDFESEKETAAQLDGKQYQRIIDGKYRWNSWAAPLKTNGSIDLNLALTGDDLRDFINDNLFIHLASLKLSADNPKTLEYKIGEIFSELRNKIQSGYSLRELINKVNELKFLSNENKHQLSSLYEDKIKNMGNAGRNGGEYYTPRPLIQSIVKIVNPTIGETVYDGAVGSAGFLCEAYDWIRSSKQLTATEYEKLQTKTLYGKEKRILAYIVGVMNMILHGIEAPNIVRTNTLEQNINDIQEKDRFDIVLANPPFGASERAELQQNFPIRTNETAYQFLQHFIKILKVGGRCGIVIKNTFLSNNDASSLRKQLLEECNLHTILDLPKVFGKTGVKTVVLFFEKGTPTKNIWYYQLNPGRNIGLTNPLNTKDMEDFHNCYVSKSESDNSWSLSIKDINKNSWDLTVNNPNHVKVRDERTPQEIIAEIEELEIQAASVLQRIKEFL